jgi:hypothetical protein
MMKNYRTLVLCLACMTLLGCQAAGRIAKNRKSGNAIVIAANAYTQDAAATFPKTLKTLVAERLLTSVPQCLCKDGKPREFIYIPGFHISDGGNFVILATPPEMDGKNALIFRIDSTSQVVPKETAAAEIQRSLEYLRKLQRDPP